MSNGERDFLYCQKTVEKKARMNPRLKLGCVEFCLDDQNG